MNREVHVRICESAGVRLPRATRLELVIKFEEAFGIGIPDDDAELMKTVQDVVKYIQRRMQEAEQGKQ